MIGRRMTRRTVLGSAAALVATPALAEDCSIGPPPHAKGPPVWMDLDQVELDAAYDQAFYAPMRLQVINRYISTSEDVRQERSVCGMNESDPARKVALYRLRGFCGPHVRTRRP